VSLNALSDSGGETDLPSEDRKNKRGLGIRVEIRIGRLGSWRNKGKNPREKEVEKAGH